MSTAYKFADQRLPYFVSFATVNWIDVFVRPAYCHILVDSLRHCQQHKGLLLHGWCIMPSHVHLVMGTTKEPMQDIMRDMKKHTAKAIIRAIAQNPAESRREWMLWMFERAGKRNPNNTRYQFWQQDSHPIELARQGFLSQKLDYLHQNPVAAGFVAESHHWA